LAVHDLTLADDPARRAGRLQVTIADLDLPRRAHNALTDRYIHNSDKVITTVAELCACTGADPNLGRLGVQAVRDALAKHGLALADGIGHDRTAEDIRAAPDRTGCAGVPPSLAGGSGRRAGADRAGASRKSVRARRRRHDHRHRQEAELLAFYRALEACSQPLLLVFMRGLRQQDQSAGPAPLVAGRGGGSDGLRYVRVAVVTFAPERAEGDSVRLVAVRNWPGLSQHETAAKVGISVRTYQDWDRPGGREWALVSASSPLMKICDTRGSLVDWMLGVIKSERPISGRGTLFPQFGSANVQMGA